MLHYFLEKSTFPIISNVDIVETTVPSDIYYFSNNICNITTLKQLYCRYYLKKIYVIKNTTILSSLCQNTCKVISHLYLYHNVKKIENGWFQFCSSLMVVQIYISGCQYQYRNLQHRNSWGYFFIYISYMNLDLLPLMRSNYWSRRHFLSKLESILYKEPFLHIFASWCNESVGNFHSLSKPVFFQKEWSFDCTNPNRAIIV